MKRFFFLFSALALLGGIGGGVVWALPGEQIATADLSVTQTASPNPAVVGNNVTYTIVLGNAGPATSSGVTLTDTLPASATFVSSAPSQGSCVMASNTVTCDMGSLAVGASATVAVIVTAVTPGPLTNIVGVTAAVSDPMMGNNTSQLTVPVNAADLSVTKTGSPSVVTVGGVVTYTMVVTNAGPSSAAGVVLTDTLPIGLTLVSAVPSQGSCSNAGGGVTCSLGTLAMGGTATVTITATGATAGTWANSATVQSSSPDPNTQNNTATASTVVAGTSNSGDISLAKTGSPASVPIGNQVVYTMVVTNLSATPSTGVVLTDTLPAGVTFLSAAPSQGSCSAAGGVVTCSLATIAAGGTATVSIAATGATAGSWTNSANVHANEADPNPANNTATATTVVTGFSNTGDIAVTKTGSPASVPIGGQVVYTMVVTNLSATPSTGVVLTDTLPAGVTFLSAAPSQGSCSAAGGVVTCSLGTLAGGGTATVTITGLATAAGTWSDSANVHANEADPNLANNTATATTVVTGVSNNNDISIAKSGAPASVPVGGQVAYSMVVTNGGTMPSTGVVVTDALPTGVTFLSAVTTQGSCSASGATVTCSLGTLAVGGTATVTIAGTATVAGVITNTASVTANEPDPNMANNTAMAVTTVGGTAAPQNGKIKLTGLIQSLPGGANIGAWRVEGLTVNVTQATKIKGTPQVGLIANVKGIVTPDGLIQATNIDVHAPKPPPSPKVKGDHRPGNGFGDKNHIHDGPPGKAKGQDHGKGHGHGHDSDDDDDDD